MTASRCAASDIPRSWSEHIYDMNICRGISYTDHTWARITPQTYCHIFLSPQDMIFNRSGNVYVEDMIIQIHLGLGINSKVLICQIWPVCDIARKANSEHPNDISNNTFNGIKWEHLKLLIRKIKIYLKIAEFKNECFKNYSHNNETKLFFTISP